MDETQPLYQEAITTFRALLDDATRGGEPEPTAMTLATADANGRLSARMVLLKSVDERGFVFYTNYASDKAEQLAAHAQVALCFLWKTLAAAPACRCAWKAACRKPAMPNPMRISRRATAPAASARGHRRNRKRCPVAKRFTNASPRWKRNSTAATCRVRRIGAVTACVPDLIELWYGQRARLHERDRYELRDGVWTKRLLYP